jgi:hypothetical protein
MHTEMTAPAEHTGRTWLVWGGVAGLLLLHAGLAWARRMPGVLTGEDEAIYLLLARELANLRYSDIFLTHQPTHAMYPPAYPAALLLWSLIAGPRFDGFLIIGIASSAGALLLTFLAVRRLVSAGVALLVLAALAVNPHLVERAGALATEAPYMLLTMVALWSTLHGDKRSVLIAGAAAIMAALTRSIGMTVFAALAANWLWGRRYAAAAVGASAALTVGAWLVWSFAAPGKLVGASYAADFAQGGVGRGTALLGFPAVLAHRMATNVPNYAGIAVPSILPLPLVGGTALDNMLAALLTVVGLTTGMLILWRSWRVAVLYVLATAAVLAIWPWYIERFVMPLLPLLVTALLLGVGAAVAHRWPRWRVTAMAAVAGMLVLTGAGQIASDLSAMAVCERGHVPPAPSCLNSDQASFFATLDYVKRETRPDAILLTTKRATAYYYTGRPQIQWQTAGAAGPDSLIAFLRNKGVGYVILGSLHWADLDQLPNGLEPNCAALELVQAFPPRTYLLRLRQPGERDDGSGCRALAEHRQKNVGRDFDRDS